MLQKAIESKDFSSARELLINGEILPSDIPDHRMTQIFDIVIREKAFDIVDLFIKKGIVETDIYEYDSFKKTIFASIVKHLSNDGESIAFLNEFLSKVQSLNDELEGKSFLSYALENEVDVEIVKTMVSKGCDVNIVSRAEETLIHQIVKKYVRSYEQGLQYLQFLHEEELDIEKPNIVGKTPLHLAVEFHKEPYIQWLLENGADPNVTDKDGVTPFFYAVANAVDHDKYKLMRKYALPQFDQETNEGETLLYETIRMMSSATDKNLNLLKMLLEDGADLYQTSTHYGHQVTAIDVLAEKPSEFLHITLDSGQLEVNRKDNDGNTILHKVCGRETLHEERRAKEVYRSVKLLLAAGADANTVNDREETPMMIASQDNMKAKTVELLLSK